MNVIVAKAAPVTALIWLKVRRAWVFAVVEFPGI